RLSRVICTRLKAEIDRVGGLPESQFGFRKARSTRHAIQEVTDLAKKAIEGKRWLWGEKEYCLVVTLDVRNAFNSANWDKIMQSLNNLSINPHLTGIIGSYLNGRILRYQTSEGTKISIVQAQEWLTNAGLSLAAHKTKAVLISSRKTVETANLTVGRTAITSRPYIKYLGVILDHRLSFRVHLKLAADKASVACSALARIMPNTRGPKELRPRLISRVVRSITTYAASIWVGAIECKSYTRDIQAVYRTCALRITSAFRT
ncbi:hypothetical protein KR215_009936, partial [Drosophila sulfurigaster]